MNSLKQHILNKAFTLSDIDKTWTLFLDRDGVINIEKQNDYIYHFGEFRFYENALKAIEIFSGIFNKILIVTNQKGIGKGLMTEASLHDIHRQMMLAIDKNNGRIDKIYYCTATDPQHSHRKPQPGMALDAKRDFPEIDFSKSVMVGNNISDMQFGKNAGMHTVFLKTTDPGSAGKTGIDMAFDDLYAFAEALCNSR